VVVEVRPGPEAAELVAFHLDGREAWRRVLPGPRRADPLGAGLALTDGAGGLLLVRTGPPGPDALVVTLDAATGATRRLSIRMPATGMPGTDGRSAWDVSDAPDGLVGRAPGDDAPAWQLIGSGLEVVATDPLLVVAPGELIGLPPPA
jgi:hypothetical protein